MHSSEAVALCLGFIFICQGAIPEQPGIPVVGKFTSETIELSWNPNINVHSNLITHYIVMWRVDGEEWNEQNSVSTTDDSANINVTGLLPFTRYSFRVAAVNSDGESNPGLPSQSIITPRKAPSESPLIIKSSSTKNSIYLAWIPSAENSLNGEFLGYRITYRELQKKTSQNIDIHDTTIMNYEINNLIQHTTYVITVQSYNGGGYGPDARIIIMTNKEDCHCHSKGSIEDTSCDKYSGQCKCKTYVTGRNCDQCKSSYWNLDDSKDGCELCLCDLGGSLDGTCDINTGQCECKPNVVGLKCEVAAPGYFAPNLDFYTFEAEYSDKAEHGKVIARTPHPDRKLTWTDSGFMQVFEGSELEFNVTLTSSMFYDIMIRYESQLPDKWDQVRVSVENPGSIETLGLCSESKPSENVKLTKLSAGRKFVLLSPPICLEAGFKYIIKLEFLSYQSGKDNPSASILIDSIVLIPVVDNLPIFQNQDGLRINEFVSNRCRDTQIAAIKRELTSTCQRFINIISFYIYDQALACSCDDVGSINGLCSPIGGVCECKPNIIGRRCDHCAPGSYNFGPTGCSLCLCNKIGTDPSASDCDSISGQCKCLKNVVGIKCNQCAPNHSNLESGKGCTLIAEKPEECNEPGFWEDNEANCNPCDCAFGGSIDILCQPITGQCQCQPNIIGHRCNRPMPGFFVPYLDFHIYEAEYASSGTNIKVITREPPANMTMTWSDIGFMQVFEHSELQFVVELPKELEYDIVVRYEAKMPETWDNVQITIERPQPVNPKGLCKNSPQIQHKIASLSPDSTYYSITPSVCLEAGILYNVMFTFGRYDRHQKTPSATIYLDSIILMPSIQSVPFFQGEGIAEIRKNEFLNHGCIETQLSVNKPDLSNICSKYISGIALFIQEQALACSCDTTGSENLDCSPLGGQCSCKRNVMGRKCDQCTPGTYGFGFEGCSLCKCNPQGFDPKLQACDTRNGQCHCLPYVTGHKCDHCSENYWNIASRKGCEPCNCSVDGSVSLKCNEFDGQCECLPGIGGHDCSECEANSWGDPNDQCQDCGCSIDGSTSLQCHKNNGSCICLPGISGENCSECEPGWSGTAPYCYPCSTCLEEINNLITSLAAGIQLFIEDNTNQHQSATFEEDSKLITKKINRVRDILMNAQDSNIDVLHELAQIDELKINFTAAIEQLNESEGEAELTETSTPTIADAITTLSDLKQRIEQVNLQLHNIFKDIITVQVENIQDDLTSLRKSKQSEHSIPETDDNDEDDDKTDDKEDKNRTKDILNKYKPIETALSTLQISLKEIEDEIPDISEWADASKVTTIPSPTISRSETEGGTVDSNLEKRLDTYKSKMQKLLQEKGKNTLQNANKIKKILHFTNLIESKQLSLFGKLIRIVTKKRINLEDIWSSVEKNLEKGQRLRAAVNKLRKEANEILKKVEENLLLLLTINTEQSAQENNQVKAVATSDDRRNEDNDDDKNKDDQNKDDDKNNDDQNKNNDKNEDDDKKEDEDKKEDDD